MSQNPKSHTLQSYLFATLTLSHEILVKKVVLF